MLRGLGYRQHWGNPLMPPLMPRERLGSVTYVGKPGQPALDLSFDPLRLFWRVEDGRDPWFDDGWSRRRTVPIGGRPTPTLSREDDLIYLARHLQFHDFFRVSWYVDLALLLRRHGEVLDWDYIGRTTRDLDVHGGVSRALELVDYAFGLGVPEKAGSAVRPNVAVRVLQRRIWPDGYALPRPIFTEGGSPLDPRYVGLRTAHPVAALLLLGAQRQRRLHFTFLFRRFVPTKRWLREAYALEVRPDAAYASLLLQHLRRLRQIRARVRAQFRSRLE